MLSIFIFSNILVRAHENTQKFIEEPSFTQSAIQNQPFFDETKDLRTLFEGSSTHHISVVQAQSTTVSVHEKFAQLERNLEQARAQRRPAERAWLQLRASRGDHPHIQNTYLKALRQYRKALYEMKNFCKNENLTYPLSFNRKFRK